MSEQLGVKVKIVPVRQALGLDEGKPNLEEILNRMWIQGYQTVSVCVTSSLVGRDGTRMDVVMATCVLVAPQEDIKDFPEQHELPLAEPKKNGKLPEPEVVTG